MKEYLASRIGDKVSLDEISYAVAGSKYHLCRIFRQSTGSTIYDYFIQLKLSEAVRRLEEGEENLSRLALDLGFSSHSHFSERFREFRGTTPSDVRAGCLNSRSKNGQS